MKLGRTCVKHKPPNPEFTKVLSTCLDGCSLRRTVPLGRHPKTRRVFRRLPEGCERLMNTAGSTVETASRMEVFMHQQVRPLPIQTLVRREELASCFGKLRQVEREAPGSLCWASFANYQVVNRTSRVQSLGEEQSYGDASRGKAGLVE